MTRRKHAGSIDLFSVVERMQRRLEAEGFAHAVVDVAVTGGLAAWLADGAVAADAELDEDARRRDSGFPGWLAPPAVAKAS